MKLKLFKKYFFTTSLIIIFSLTIMLMIMVFVLNQFISKTKFDSLNEYCVSIADFVQDSGNEAQNNKNLYHMMYTLSNASDADIFMADNDGIIRICGCDEWYNSGSCEHTDHIIPKDELQRMTNADNFEVTTLGFFEKQHYVAAMSLTDASGEKIGTVFAASPISSIKNITVTVFKLYFISAAIPLILMFLAIYAMTYRLTKPLKLMSEATKAMAKGDFSKRIPVTSDDEIGELSASFNQMTNSLVQQEGMRKSFVANVSHELKTPMTTIGGFIDGILDGTIERDKESYYLNIVSNEVKRLSRLVQSMLSMAKLESGEFVLKPELFDFRELLCTIVISQEQRIEKGHLNISGLDEIESISLTADRDLIHQVIYNLVDNAIKFTNEEGTISFSAKTVNKRLIFEISNTGKGIPEKELPFVFERFYKVDKSRSANKNSTGLGLYIVKSIVKAHGGSISVSSKENEFTTFKVILPLG